MKQKIKKNRSDVKGKDMKSKYTYNKDKNTLKVWIKPSEENQIISVLKKLGLNEQK